MKKRRRLKKQVYYILALIIVLVVGIICISKYIKYINTYEYKLEQLGYSKEEIKVILKQEENNIDDILNRKYEKKIVSFMKQKYFLYKNLDSYLNYYKKNKNDKMSHVVSIVNVKADHEWYDEKAIVETDTSLGNLILVNKFYHLSEQFKPNDIKNINTTYAYSNNSASEEVIKAFITMANAAKDEDLYLIVNSSYRDYEDQQGAWDYYDNKYGEEKADKFAARPGHSEHQTGLAIDIAAYKNTSVDFAETDEFKWLEKNAYKYGFILRYPKGKEDITGYDYESWHYRYVGKETAKKIKDLKITYDEYYAYFIEK